MNLATQLQSPGVLAWDDSLLAGHGPMDDTHREFVDLVNRLLTCPPAVALQCLEAFAAHSARHFSEEKAWMSASAFPSAQCHLDEHDKVQASVDQVLSHLRAGLAGQALVRSLARHLADWFPGHVAHMDSALAAWLTQVAHGGAPVVVRRNAALAVLRS